MKRVVLAIVMFGLTLMCSCLFAETSPELVNYHYIDLGIGKAVSINNSGVIVGEALFPTSADVPHAFVSTPSGGMVDLTPGYFGHSSAISINDNGYIVGTVFDADEKPHVVLWEPVPTPVFSISGQLTLGDFVGDITKIPISVDLRKQGGERVLSTINLQKNGRFALNDLSIGTYEVFFKADHWLGKTFKNLLVFANVTGLKAALFNGDADNNNTVNAQDAALVKKASGSRPSAKKWNPNADLNGDNKINRLDAQILQKNLGQVGDQ